MRRSIFVMMAILWAAGPLLACLPPATMTDAEMACCKNMAGHCDMGSGQHSCCKDTIDRSSSAAVVQNFTPEMMDATGTTLASARDLLLPNHGEAAVLRQVALEVSPPLSQTILRI
jgi:hypothetical protein